MAKKKQKRNTTPQTAIGIPNERTEDVEPTPPSPVVVTSRGVGRGNTADMAQLFDEMFAADDLEILKDFPERKEIVGILRSMYSNALSLKSRRTVWGKAVLAFELALNAFDDGSIFTRLDVELPPQYPRVVPVLRLLQLEPEDEAFRQQLKNTIAHFEKTEIGDDQMIFSTLQAIQDKLDDLSADRQRRAQVASLEQERATVEDAAKADASLQQQLAMRQKEEEAAVKEAKLAQDVESHRRRRQLLSSAENGIEDRTTAGEDYPEACVVFDRDITLHDSHFDSTLNFRAVQPMSILYQREGKIVTVANPYRNGKLVKIQMVLKEVRLPEASESEAEYRATLGEVESALQEVKTFDHSAIVKVYEYKLEQVFDQPSYPTWELSILTEHAQQSLDTLLDMVGGLNAVKARIYTRSILDALEFYDKKGYVHPAIHAYNILLFGSQHGSYQAKLSDGYGTTLRALVDNVQKGQISDAKQGNWAAPELIEGQSTRTNKTCMWELGVVLLQMALGNDMTKKYTSPEDALSQAGFDQDFDYLISKMCTISARKRPSAFQAQSFQFFKNHQHSFFISKVRQGGDVTNLSRSRNIFESRWESEWEPVEKLGKGGFGTVFKARHRLDGHFYAVKQLKCRSTRDLQDIWGEVRLLAKLNHPGVVRYFVAWSEEDLPESTDTGSSTALTDPRSFAPPVDSVPLRSSLFAGPSTGHDFMDPSLAQLSDVEEDDDNPRQDESSADSDDGNMFGYQSAPSDEQDESQVVESADEMEDEPSDPFGLQAAANNLDDDPNLFESNGTSDAKVRTNIPSRPQPFVAAKGTPSAIRRPPQYYNQSSTLYIQMELCETGTLYDLIKDGLADKIEESWRIFRLLLDGLEYIHAQGVVHRDLKPMNIFIDSQRMPKIGDFGLAAPSQATADGHKLATHVAGPMSKGIGTVFYIAPELNDARASGRYTSKVDMFALGIIFFEMCFPFKTYTERMNWLSKMNKNASSLPAQFDREEYKIQARIIRSLLEHKADQRPSAKDLLLDPEIPEPLEEDREQRYLQRLIQGDPAQLQAVMKNFMNKQATKTQLLAYAYVDQLTFEQPDPYLVCSIQDKLGEVFRAHGGVQTNRQMVFPVEGFYPNAVKFLDAAGFTVQLPYDLTVPFARSIAVRRPEYAKSFCFGSVSRQRKDIGVEPLSIPEVDFDHVSYSAHDLSLRDAQVLSVLDDCLIKLAPSFRRNFSITVSHSDLLDLVLRACEVPEARFEIVKRLLSNLNVGKTTWKQVQPELQSPAVGLTVTSAEALGQFGFACSFVEMRQRVLSTLKKLKKDDAAINATRTLNRLQEIDEYLTQLGVKTSVLFSPLCNTSEILYRGSVMFRCVESRMSKIVAVGGRYDALIRTYQTPTQKTFARASGFRINVLDLASFARNDALPPGSRATKQKSLLPPSIPSRVDVVVTSFDESTLHNTCVEILRSVLDAGFSAELSEPVTSMEELEQMYIAMPKYWTVIVRPGGTKFKVRSPSKDESDVPQSEIVSFLKEEMGERQLTGPSEPVLRRTRSSHGAADRENVTILTPQHKSKKVNRAVIVDSARSSALDLSESMSKNSKVLAIDTDDETLQRIRNTRLADGESWRSLRHAVALTERDYVQEIQEQLQEWNRSGLEGAFLCNYKTKTCIYYDFGRG